VGNHLEVALGRIASEAVRHGEFELRSRFRLSADGSVIEVLVENDLPVEERLAEPRSEGRGARELAFAVDQIPGGALHRREAVDSSLGIPVFAVAFSLSAASFTARDGR
jgi:hypothetical protein